MATGLSDQCGERSFCAGNMVKEKKNPEDEQRDRKLRQKRVVDHPTRSSRVELSLRHNGEFQQNSTKLNAANGVFGLVARPAPAQQYGKRFVLFNFCCSERDRLEIAASSSNKMKQRR